MKLHLSPLHVTLSPLHVTFGLPQHIEDRLASIESNQIAILAGIRKLMASNQELLAAIKQADDDTNAIGVGVAAIGINLGTIATVVGTIGTEVQALQTALASSGVDPEVLARLAALGAKAAAIKTSAERSQQAADALVPELNNIAAAGAPAVTVPPPVDPVEVP